jgi:hypothetical protein
MPPGPGLVKEQVLFLLETERRPGRHCHPALEALREPSLEEFGESRCHLELRDRFQASERRSESIRETPDCLRPGVLIFRFEVQVVHRACKMFGSFESTPTETQSISENDFECLASTGVNTPETIFPIRAAVAISRSPFLGSISEEV